MSRLPSLSNIRSNIRRSSLASLVLSALGIGATLFVAGCGGGGCSSGCAGSQVIPKGFPAADRVGNSAGVRVTRTGLDFIQANLGSVITKVLSSGGGTVTGGVLTFQIPESKGSVKNPIPFLPDISYTVCPGGPKPTEDPPKCVVEINIAKIHDVTIQSNTPHDLNIGATIPIKLRNLPLDVAGISATAGLGVGAADACGTLDYVDVPTTADVSLENIPDDATHHARAGYTKINIVKVDFDQKPVQDNFKFCGSGIGTDILNLLKPLLIGFVSGGLTGNLTGPLQDATCMKAQKLPDGTEQCPDGTHDVSSTCRYGTDSASECVPMLLGLESRFDLSGLLASLSPGTSGGLDFLLASGGDMNPADGKAPATNGITLNMLGGGQPFPISQCVPQAPNPLPAIPDIPDELKVNAITPWGEATPPHLGFAIAEAFLNHAATAAYNSGLFCIGISSEQVPQLDGALFSTLLNSINEISDKFSAGDSHPSMGLAIRPQKPPQITVGDNTADFKSPLLDIKLPQTNLDFYMWSEDRFIRMFTGTVDIEVPADLTSKSDGLHITLPAKNPISFTNGKVTNNMLLEDDTKVASIVQSIGSIIPSSALSNIKPFNLNSSLASLGLTMDIPPDGIRKLTLKTGERFLGIFANLAVATSAHAVTRTSARITSFEVDKSSYTKLETFGTNPAKIWVHADSDLDDGAHEVEYAYQVDQATWTSYEKGRDFQLESPFFKFEGKHVVNIASRIVGQPMTEGAPTTIPVVIDVQPPKIVVKAAEPGFARVIVSDVVSAARDLHVEVRVDEGEWTTVPVEASIKDRVLDQAVKVAEGATLDVRATDESGNVGTISSPVLRGRADPGVPGGGSCGCRVPGSSDANGTSSEGWLAVGSLAVVGAVIERRRRRNRARSLALGSMMVLGAGASGCSCGASGGGDNNQGPTGPAEVTYVIGSYTSAQIAKDGTIWVAGYHEGDPSTGNADDFKGDLVVGKWDAPNSQVAWTVVDGVPAVQPTLDHNGFRGGITDPGDDVGLYTSMALDANDHPMVAYYDRTNGGLRFASYDGNKWSSHDVTSVAKGWAGKFTSMAMLSGKPVVAFQQYEPGSGGFGKARVRLARATSATPGSSSDWQLEDVALDDKAACIQDICSSGQKCLVKDAASSVDPICSSTISGCDASCTDVCIKGPKDGKPLCAKAVAQLEGFDDAMGSYISLAASSSGALGIVFYDRSRGNLRSGTVAAGKWNVTPATAPFDGWTGDAAKDKGNGDRGIGASLAIDATGNWHVSYVDGLTEGLLYRFVPGGDVTKAAAPIVVDDGLSADGSATKFTDGQHLVGDNSQLTINGTNVVIVYQDATAGTLHWAKATGGATAKFTRGVIKQDGFSGFFPKTVGTSVANFFRQKGTTAADPVSGNPGDPVILGNVRVVPLP